MKPQFIEQKAVVDMPGQARPVTDERDGLLVFLGQMRLVLKVSAYGLTDDQAREAAASPSTLTVGGLIKHSAAVERSWAAMIQGRRLDQDHVATFRLGPDETLASVIAVRELLFTVQIIYARNFLTIPLLLVASIWYLIITSILTFGQFYLERYFGKGSQRTLPPTPLQRLRALFKRNLLIRARPQRSVSPRRDTA